MKLNIVVSKIGIAQMLYSSELDSLQDKEIHRASRVEFCNKDMLWHIYSVDLLTDYGGFRTRKEALKYEEKLVYKALIEGYNTL